MPRGPAYCATGSTAARLAALALTAATLVGVGSASARLPFTPPSAAARAPTPIPPPAPWFAIAGDIPLAQWGSARSLPVTGTARVQLRIAGPLPRFGLSLVIDAPDVTIGGQPVGRLSARIFVPFDGDGFAGRIVLDGPAGRLSVEGWLPERFSPGSALVEAILMPWQPEPTSDGADEAAGDAAHTLDPAALSVSLPVAADDEASLLDLAQSIAADWSDAPIVRIRAEDFELERLTDLWPELALGGRVSGSFALDAAGMRASIDVPDVSWRGGRLGPTEVRLAVDGRQTRLTARTGLAPASVRLDATAPINFDSRHLTFDWRDAEATRVRLRAERLTPESLFALHRFHPAADFVVDVSADVQGPLDRLDANARLVGTLRDGGVLRPLVGAIDVGPTAQKAAFRVGEADVALVSVELATTADLVALRRTATDPAAAPLSGGLTLGVPLSTLLPYLPAAIHGPTGALAGQVVVDGTLGAPALQGAIGLTDGALTLVAANARLVDVDLDLRFAGDRARLEALSARSGRGRLSGEGAAQWVVTPAGHAGPLWGGWRLTAEAGLTLDDVPLVRPGLPAGLLDARASATLSAGPEHTIADVTIADTDLRLTGFQLADARPIARNGAVRRRSQGALRRADAWLAGAGALDLTVRLPEGRVEGDDTALTFGGEVTVRRRDDDFTVEGGIEAGVGRFRLFDNGFDLTGGRFSIQGGTLDPQAAVAVAIGQARLAEIETAPAADTLDPIIDIRAAGRVVETDVRVRIVGPSRRPSLVLESDPPLPEYQILTLLITGRVDAIDERNGQVRRQAAKLIDRFHNPSLARQLYDRLGVDKLGLKFGASVTNPILTVGKQINRRLYVETVYHHDAPPDANEKEARVEYRLSPRWTVDTVAGDAGEGSLGVFWQTHFGRPEAPADGEPATD